MHHIHVFISSRRSWVRIPPESPVKVVSQTLRKHSVHSAIHTSVLGKIKSVVYHPTEELTNLYIHFMFYLHLVLMPNPKCIKRFIVKNTFSCITIRADFWQGMKTGNEHFILPSLLHKGHSMSNQPRISLDLSDLFQILGNDSLALEPGFVRAGLTFSNSAFHQPHATHELF